MERELYDKRKAIARAEAMEYLTEILPNSDLTIEEKIRMKKYFKNRAKNFGLRKEFKKLGII